MLLLAIAFIAGIAAMGWGLSRWDAGRAWLFGSSQPDRVPAITYDAVKPNAAIAPPLSNVDVDLAARLADLEGRMAKVEAGSISGEGSSARAEGLLIAFAARRALERGLGLGYVEGMLNQHFGATQPRAVATVIAASRQPVTLEQLQAGLTAVAPALAGAPTDGGLWNDVKHSLSGLFVVRKEGSASPLPDVRIAEAQRFIQNGRVDLALAEVARLPNRNRAANWIAMARRYVEAQRALDLLEAAAITTREPVVRSF